MFIMARYVHTQFCLVAVRVAAFVTDVWTNAQMHFAHVLLQTTARQCSTSPVWYPHVIQLLQHNQQVNYYYYVASAAAVAVDSSYMTASSSASCSRFSPPSNCVNGYVSTTWLMVCQWPQPQEGDSVRPHLSKRYSIML